MSFSYLLNKFKDGNWVNLQFSRSYIWEVSFPRINFATKAFLDEKNTWIKKLLVKWVIRVLTGGSCSVGEINWAIFLKQCSSWHEFSLDTCLNKKMKKKLRKKKSFKNLKGNLFNLFQSIRYYFYHSSSPFVLIFSPLHSAFNLTFSLTFSNQERYQTVTTQSVSVPAFLKTPVISNFMPATTWNKDLKI